MRRIQGSLMWLLIPPSKLSESLCRSLCNSYQHRFAIAPLAENSDSNCIHIGVTITISIEAPHTDIGLGREHR